MVAKIPIESWSSSSMARMRDWIWGTRICLESAERIGHMALIVFEYSVQAFLLLRILLIAS
jgi:hypothetical protein